MLLLASPRSGAVIPTDSSANIILRLLQFAGNIARSIMRDPSISLAPTNRRSDHVWQLTRFSFLPPLSNLGSLNEAGRHPKKPLQQTTRAWSLKALL